MKFDVLSSLGVRCYATCFLVLGLGNLQAQTAVDTELVLLVEHRTSGSSDFDLILDSVADAFEQQSFIDSVAAGSLGSIAATLILFNSNSGQTLAIPWLELSSASDLQGFANTVRSVRNLTSGGGNVDYAGAIAAGAAQTASAAFEGTIRQLTIIDDGTGFFEASPAATQNARDAALASSVDVINAVVFDTQGVSQTQTAEDYYNANVVGGADGSVSVIANNLNPRPAEITTAIEGSIITAVTSPTVNASASASAIPEPSSFFLTLVAGMGLLIRRRR